MHTVVFCQLLFVGRKADLNDDDDDDVNDSIVHSTHQCIDEGGEGGREGYEMHHQLPPLLLSRAYLPPSFTASHYSSSSSSISFDLSQQVIDFIIYLSLSLSLAIDTACLCYFLSTVQSNG